jgi:hypothetical protein
MANPPGSFYLAKNPSGDQGGEQKTRIVLRESPSGDCIHDCLIF